MTRRFAAFLYALVLAATALAPSTSEAQSSNVNQLRPDGAIAGINIPVNATSANQGSFTGNIRILRFAEQNGQVVAIGLLTGTRNDGTGSISSIVRTIVLPVVAQTAGAVTAAQTCAILNLVLGPLDLDLLGLVVHLDRVVLDVSAVPGAGNLLGNLLCAITHLLDGPGAILQLVTLLNQLLDLLS